MGNEAIVKGLVDMRKYWDALEGDFRVEVSSEAGEDEKKGRTHSVNHGVSAALETVGIKKKYIERGSVNAVPYCSFQPVLSVHRARIGHQPHRVLHAC